ncbi:MAG: Type 1 glutamine amidotransferase-like domain-containing protein [Lachnospiraceae bacterium]|nr:Type 1 glutamine amidotransferase-like domain-containing protein [Lachnospiraceae bacterium]
MKTILTSSLGGQIKANGRRIPTALSEDNGLLQLLRSVWKPESKVLIISGSPEYYEKNDDVRNCLKESFRLSGLSHSEFLMCDGRNKDIAGHIPETDAVILAGGHVPTQNAFMKEIGLKEKLADYKGLILAWSAGSMNSAKTVYAGPELPGEAIDPSYRRWISGLGLTETNIFPHFESLREEMLDGMRLIEDITFADSMGHEITALNNGSYIVSENGVETLYGEAYSIKDGVMKQICRNGGSIILGGQERK